MPFSLYFTLSPPLVFADAIISVFISWLPPIVAAAAAIVRHYDFRDAASCHIAAIRHCLPLPFATLFSLPRHAALRRAYCCHAAAITLFRLFSRLAAVFRRR